MSLVILSRLVDLALPYCAEQSSKRGSNQNTLFFFSSFFFFHRFSTQTEDCYNQLIVYQNSQFQPYMRSKKVILKEKIDAQAAQLLTDTNKEGKEPLHAHIISNHQLSSLRLQISNNKSQIRTTTKEKKIVESKSPRIELRNHENRTCSSR